MILDLAEDFGGRAPTSAGRRRTRRSRPRFPRARSRARRERIRARRSRPRTPLNRRVLAACACLTREIEFNSQLPNAVRAATLTAATVRAPGGPARRGGAADRARRPRRGGRVLAGAPQGRGDAPERPRHGSGDDLGDRGARGARARRSSGSSSDSGWRTAAIAALGPGGSVERAALRRGGRARRRARADRAGAPRARRRASPSRASSARGTTTTDRSRSVGAARARAGRLVPLQAPERRRRGRPVGRRLAAERLPAPLPDPRDRRVAGLAARLFVRLARLWRGRASRPATYLAAHRLAAARRLLAGARDRLRRRVRPLHLRADRGQLVPGDDRARRRSSAWAATCAG